LSRTLEEQLQIESNNIMDELSKAELTELEKQTLELNKLVTQGDGDASDGGGKDDAARTSALWKSIGRRFAIQAGQGIGVAIAKSRGSDPAAVQTGGNIGASVGGPIGLLAGGPAGFLLGSTIGQAAGSILGGLFGKKEEPKEDEIKILAQIEKNTAQLVDRLTADIFNAPAAFTLPAGQGFALGGGVTIHNTISVSGDGLGVDTLDTLSQQLEDVYSRSPNSLSSLR